MIANCQCASCAMLRLWACKTVSPAARLIWYPIGGGCALLRIYISPFLPCTKVGGCLPQVGIQLGPQKAALALLVMHALRTPTPESNQMLMFEQRRTLCHLSYIYRRDTCRIQERWRKHQKEA
ncbi:TPA: hypothetical protein ACH3X2_012446 [Trebouxia sp. C0005]